MIVWAFSVGSEPSIRPTTLLLWRFSISVFSWMVTLVGRSKPLTTPSGVSAAASTSSSEVGAPANSLAPPFRLRLARLGASAPRT